MSNKQNDILKEHKKEFEEEKESKGKIRFLIDIEGNEKDADAHVEMDGSPEHIVEALAQLFEKAPRVFEMFEMAMIMYSLKKLDTLKDTLTDLKFTDADKDQIRN